MREFRLCDEDRKRFGCDEWIPWDVWAISIADLDELSQRFGFDPDDWPTPFFGELTLEQAGNPDAQPKPPRWQKQAAFWMALHQSGLDVSWDEVATVQQFKAVTRESPGKDPEADTDPSTTQPSPTSTD